jgi:ABC-type Fe3+ transport system permease subunit/DNA-binding beta-propeller fold protein YncE
VVDRSSEEKNVLLRSTAKYRSETRSCSFSGAAQQHAFLWAAPVWFVVILCCALPLGWMSRQQFRRPGSLGTVVPTVFYRGLLFRTLAYSLGVAIVATVLALPAAIVLGRGRGKFAAVLWIFLPAALLMPSITYAYGWSQFLRILNLTPGLATPADVMRCVWTLATWLWPIPAGVLALAIRRTDPDVQQQALLDGALWRLTARQLAGPAAAAAACVLVLASQEFSVYEPTGISVVATEVRMVFETGAFSSPDNPITQAFMSGNSAALRDTSGGEDSPPMPTKASGFHSASLITQDQRAGAAVATSLPLLLVALLLGGLGMLGVRRVSAITDELHDAASFPRILEPGVLVKCLAVLIVILTLLVPTAAMIASLRIHRPIGEIWTRFSPQASGSIILAVCSAGWAGVVAFSGAVRRARGSLVLSLAAFLIGGQLLAIALIRLYNRPAPWPLGAGGGGGGNLANRHDLFDFIYNGIPIVVMAYLARFGWLALLAAGFTRTRAWRQIRELMALDGATPLQAARHIIWPLAWPVLAAGALLVGVLSLTEVPATVLISPLRPQPLTPMLMGWVHMVRYDDMIEGSLLLMSMAFVLSVCAALLIALGVKFFRSTVIARQRPAVAIAGLFAAGLMIVSSSGCSDGKEPEAVWLETGSAPGQVVYPRAITYAPNDNTFFIVDRLARVQHLDAKGNALTEWRMPEWRIGKPVGVSIGPDGNVYVPDTHYNRIIVYSPDGKEIRRWGERGTKPGQFIWPTDIAFDKSGNIYISEYGDNDRIQVFSPDGKLLRGFGHFGNGNGEFSRPQSMVINDDTIYVTDACNSRIAVFKTDGTWVRNMGSVGSQLGQFRFPYGMDEDHDGHLVVCEFGNNRVQLVDKQTGKGIRAWGTPGRDPGQLAYPWAVTVDRAGRIVAVDSGNNRVQVFEF